MPGHKYAKKGEVEEEDAGMCVCVQSCLVSHRSCLLLFYLQERSVEMRPPLLLPCVCVCVLCFLMVGKGHGKHTMWDTHARLSCGLWIVCVCVKSEMNRKSKAHFELPSSTVTSSSSFSLHHHLHSISL